MNDLRFSFQFHASMQKVNDNLITWSEMKCAGMNYNTTLHICILNELAFQVIIQVWSLRIRCMSERFIQSSRDKTWDVSNKVTWTQAWWQLLNFIMRKVKFNRFLHPNEDPLRKSWYAVISSDWRLSKNVCFWFSVPIFKVNLIIQNFVSYKNIESREQLLSIHT